MESTQGSPAATPSTPPPSASGGPPLSPTEAIAAGWRAFLANPWVSIGVFLVLMAIALVGQMIPFVNLVFSILVAPALYAGGAWFFLRGIRNENPPFECAFDGFKRWPSVTGAGLVLIVVAILILCPMFLALFGTVGLVALLGTRPGHMPDLATAVGVPFFVIMAITYPVLIWWGARAYMTLFVVMEADRPSAMEAVRRSFALTRGSVWRMVGLFLLCIPIALLGLLALCIGIIPAAIIQYYSFAHAYEQLRARAQ